jgi:prolyl-tRNA synthetase
MSIAPYQIHLVTLGNDAAVISAAKHLYEKLEHAGIEVLWDDRDERPGVKFKDADLIGIPLRVTIGARGLAAGTIECKARVEPDPKKAELIPLAEAVAVLTARVEVTLGGS